MAISLNKLLEGSWEKVRKGLWEDLQTIEESINRLTGGVTNVTVNQTTVAAATVVSLGSLADQIARTGGVVLIEGAEGAEGELGIPGPQGPLGFTGLAGSPGVDGTDGVDGDPGVTGIPGPAGPMGSLGPPGQDGEDGTAGWPEPGLQANYAWTDVAYAAGNFTTQAAVGSWDVQSADQILFQFIKIGRLATVNIVLDLTSVLTTGPQGLQITLPFAPLRKVKTVAVVQDNSSTVSEVDIATCAAGSTTLLIQKPSLAAFALSANNTYVSVSLTFEW